MSSWSRPGPSRLLSHPGGDRPDLVVGKALRNAPHYRRRALPRAESLHRRRDCCRVLPAQRRHLCFCRGARRMTPRARRRPGRRLRRRGGGDDQGQRQHPYPPRYARHPLPHCGRGARMHSAQSPSHSLPRQRGRVRVGAWRVRGAAHTRFRSWPLSGSARMRLPVAAKIALSTAGAATQIVGSPTPPQKSPDGMMTTSTLGISSIRITL